MVVGWVIRAGDESLREVLRATMLFWRERKSEAVLCAGCCRVLSLL